MYENIKHKKEGFDATQDKWFCPNCAELVFGYKDENGQTKVRCPKCGTAMTKYKKSRTTITIEVRAPKYYR